MRIPSEFKLFATKFKVVWDNKYCNDKDRYGEASYGESKITLSTTQGLVTLSEDRIMDCFYHEKVHCILDSMHERDLSNNEKFIDTFAKLLRQSDETSIF